MATKVLKMRRSLNYQLKKKERCCQLRTKRKYCWGLQRRSPKKKGKNLTKSCRIAIKVKVRPSMISYQGIKLHCLVRALRILIKLRIRTPKSRDFNRHSKKSTRLRCAKKQKSKLGRKSGRECTRIINWAVSSDKLWLSQLRIDSSDFCADQKKDESVDFYIFIHLSLS